MWLCALLLCNCCVQGYDTPDSVHSSAPLVEHPRGSSYSYSYSYNSVGTREKRQHSGSHVLQDTLTMGMRQQQPRLHLPNRMVACSPSNPARQRVSRHIVFVFGGLLTAVCPLPRLSPTHSHEPVATFQGSSLTHHSRRRRLSCGGSCVSNSHDRTTFKSDLSAGNCCYFMITCKTGAIIQHRRLKRRRRKKKVQRAHPSL